MSHPVKVRDAWTAFVEAAKAAEKDGFRVKLGPSVDHSPAISETAAARPAETAQPEAAAEEPAETDAPRRKSIFKKASEETE